MRLRSVDLPQPEAPRRHTNSPGAMSSETSSSTTGPVPNRFETPFMRTAGAGAGAASRTGATPSKLGPSGADAPAPGVA